MSAPQYPGRIIQFGEPEVGSLTWGALFAEGSVATTAGPSDRLLGEALGVAAGELGVLEEPPGSNRGPRPGRPESGGSPAPTRPGIPVWFTRG